MHPKALSNKHPPSPCCAPASFQLAPPDGPLFGPAKAAMPLFLSRLLCQRVSHNHHQPPNPHPHIRITSPSTTAASFTLCTSTHQANSPQHRPEVCLDVTSRPPSVGKLPDPKPTPIRIAARFHVQLHHAASALVATVNGSSELDPGLVALRPTAAVTAVQLDEIHPYARLA